MSEKILPKPSNEYVARRNGGIVIKQEESGALSAYIPYTLLGLQDLEFSDVHKVTLVKIDGTVLTNSMTNILKIWPDAAENYPFSLEELSEQEDKSKPEFKLSDCYHDNSWTPEGETEPVIQFKARWLNPLEGGGRMPAPMTDDERKQILAKFGSKFNALKPKPVASKSSGGIPSRSKGPASRKTEPEPEQEAEVFECTGDEVFEALAKKYPKEHKVNADALAEKAFVAAEKASSEYKKSGNIEDVTGEHWGDVAVSLGLKDDILKSRE